MLTLRDRVVAALDVRRYYESEGLEPSDAGEDQYLAQCPFHSDTTPSLGIRKSDGVFNCFGCSATGSVFDFHIRKNAIEGTPAEQFAEAMSVLAEFAKVPLPDTQPLPSEEIIETWNAALMKDKTRLKWLEEKRALKVGSLRESRVGWDGERLTIPIRNAAGTLINVRRYLPNSRDKRNKMVGIAGHNGRALWPGAVPGGKGPVVFSEGELDRLVLTQHLFRGITVTSGAGNWRSDWTSLFTALDIVIAYDADEAGKRGAQRVGSFLATVARSVRILSWPKGVKKGYDITDFFLEHTKEEFQLLLDAATAFVPTKILEANGHYERTDEGNSRQFVKGAATNLLYIAELKKFFVWEDDGLARG